MWCLPLSSIGESRVGTSAISWASARVGRVLFNPPSRDPSGGLKRTRPTQVTQKVATAALANFKQVVKDKPIRIHPIVSQLVDPAVLEKMKVRPVGEAEGKVKSKEQGKEQGT